MILQKRRKNKKKKQYINKKKNMRNLKNLKRFESFQNEDSIENLCSKYGIKDYEIRGGYVFVYGNVDLRNMLGNLKKLPFTFSEVRGNFDCSGNNLTTLEGCPMDVGGYFNCSWNKLTSLEHSPKIVEGDYICRDVNTITSLEGLEDCIIRGLLDVSYCINLSSRKGYPDAEEDCPYAFDAYMTPLLKNHSRRR